MGYGTGKVKKTAVAMRIQILTIGANNEELQFMVCSFSGVLAEHGLSMRKAQRKNNRGGVDLVSPSKQCHVIKNSSIEISGSHTS